jgi:hypothetical protein
MCDIDSCGSNSDHSSEFDMIEFMNVECEAALASGRRLSKKIIELHAEIRDLREQVATYAKAS